MPESDSAVGWATPDLYLLPQQLMWLGLVQSMQVLQNWQRLANRYTQDLLSNERFLDTGGKTTEGLVQIKHRARGQRTSGERGRAMETAISSVQMPTKSDIEHLLQRLSLLENLMRDLDDKVDQILYTEQEL